MKVYQEKKISGAAVSVIDERYNRKTDILMSSTEALGAEGMLAIKLISEWGVVAADIDGEDSAGRQRVRRMTPQELVTHACETAELAYKEVRSRGWTMAIPTPAEAEQIYAAQNPL